MSTATVSVDEFQALEQRVTRAVELIKQEREARAAAEAEVAELKRRLAEQMSMASGAQSEVDALLRDRDAVRQRVEKMLQQMDDLL
jgi:hypothetical protein